MRSIAHYDHGQKSERMKFLRIIFGCPEGARKWRILYFAMLLHSKMAVLRSFGSTARPRGFSAVRSAAAR